MGGKKRKNKFDPGEGLRLDDFEKLTNNNDEQESNKQKIATIYKLFINNKKFQEIESDNKKKEKLKILQSYIQNALKIESKIALPTMSLADELFKYRDTLTKTIKHIDKKLKDKKYNKFRIKGNPKKILLKLAETGSFSKAIQSDETESLSRSKVEDVQWRLKEFLELVEKYINKIIKYNPLLRIKNNINTILENRKIELEENINYSDNSIKSIISDINTNIIPSWRDTNKKLCTDFKTLNTEHSFTKYLRKSAGIFFKLLSIYLVAKKMLK